MRARSCSKDVAGAPRFRVPVWLYKLISMLVRFKSDVGGFTMFGDIAQKLLRLCGHSATVPGAIPAEDVADALQRLRSALAAVPEEPQGQADGDADGEKEPPVPLRRRAFPLLELLGKAVDEGCGVQWDEP